MQAGTNVVSLQLMSSNVPTEELENYLESLRANVKDRFQGREVKDTIIIVQEDD